MKTLSQVAKLSDAPETLEEARALIDSRVDALRERTNALHELRMIVRDYLAYSSIDGRPERLKLRQKLWEICH
jgi:hypothetical protein